MPHTSNSHIVPTQKSQLSDYKSLTDRPNLDEGNETLTEPQPAVDTVDWFYTTQELLDTLPRVWTRGLLYMLVTFAAIALPWAMLSKVDETGTARGRLEPKSKTVQLDAPVAGTVVGIQVKEGESVKAGQVLLQLASDLVRSDLQQAQAKLEGQLNRLTQLNLSKNQLEIATSTQRLQSQAQETEQLTQIEQTQQRLDSSRKAYALANNRLALDQKEVQRYRKSWQENVVPEVKVVEAERIMNESQKLVEQSQSDTEQAQSELKKQQSTYQRLIRTGELTLLESSRQLDDLQAQIVSLEAEIAQTKNQIKSLQFQIHQRTIRASITGTIFQLPIQKAGAVIQPGQLVAQIAPRGTPLILRAQMPSQESGFLQVGMPAKLKFDAYPFQDYGIVEGQVSWVSPDSKTNQTSQNQTEAFELEIDLEQTYIQTANRRITLNPGQAATVEVVVRQRRLIDFILDPLKKLQRSGLKL